MKKIFFTFFTTLISLELLAQNGRRPESAADKIGSAVAGAIILSLVIWLFNRNKEKKAERNYNENLDTAKKVSSINPNDYHSLFTLGIENYKNKNDDIALQYFQKCFQLDSSRIENLFFIGNIYHLTGHFDKVIEVGNQFYQMLEKNKKSIDFLLTNYKLPMAEFQYFLGYSYLKYGNEGEAKAYKKTALNLHPELEKVNLY